MTATPTPSTAPAPPWRLARVLLAAVGAWVAGTGTVAAADGPAPPPAARRPEMVSTKDSSAASAPKRGRTKAFAPERLVPLLPERLGGWQRLSLEAPKRSEIESPGPTLRAEYEQGAQAATLSIEQRRGASGMAAWTGAPIERRTAGGREAIYKSGTRLLREEFRELGNESSVTCTLANGLVLIAISQSADTAALKGLIEAVDLAQAERLAR